MDRSELSRLALLFALGIGIAPGCRTPGEDLRSRPAPESERAEPATVAPTAHAPTEPGVLPSTPLPRGAIVELAGFRVEVTDFQRGATAERMLRDASRVNRPPPQGSEFVLLQLRLTGVGRPKSWVGCKDFRVVGADRVAYFHGWRVPPAPVLEDGLLKEGERTDGWCVYPVHENDRGLILMITDPGSRLPKERRYLALEKGAALTPVAIAAQIPSESAGQSPLAAAPLRREVFTQDWSVTAVEILRGDAARRLVEDANSRNPAPAEGLEFVAVKLRARYRGRTEHPGLLSRSAFRMIGGDGKPYESPIVLDVTPRLGRTLLPGGEHTGWVVLQVAPGDMRAVLRFQPLYPDRDRRYFALVGSAHSDTSRSE